MNTSIIEETESAIRFRVSDINYGFANALRRIATNSVESFAVDSVTFYENTSSMFDEYIAHRIGLVPILTPNSGYDEKDEILFSLEAEGPKIVYSKELKSSDKKVKVANEDIPIIKLAEGQRLRLDGKAVMGRAMKSAKFQPGLVTYKQLSDDEFEFYIETFGQMSAREILNKTLDIINKQIKATYKELKK